jgi:hypothetical protein
VVKWLRGEVAKWRSGEVGGCALMFAGPRRGEGKQQSSKQQSSKFGRGGGVAEWQSGRLGVDVRGAAAGCWVNEEERAVVLGLRLRSGI